MNKSSLVPVGEGYAGPAKVRGITIRYPDDTYPIDPGRVLVKDGQFTEQATPLDRARLAPKMKPKPAPKPKPKRLGRKPTIAHLKPEVERLRAQGVSWTEIGRRLRIKPEGARSLLDSRRRTA